MPTINMAQWLSWLECRPVTPEVEGSSPFWVAILKLNKGINIQLKITSMTLWPLGQAVKTPPFHGGNRGSIPLGVTICYFFNGRIAQLGEHLPYKQGVTGSSPVVPTINIWPSGSVG